MTNGTILEIPLYIPPENYATPDSGLISFDWK